MIGRDLVVPDLDAVLVGLEQDDLLLAEDVEQAGEELVVVLFFKNVRILQLDEIFQVPVGQGDIGDGQDDLLFDGRRRVDRGRRFASARGSLALGEKNGEKKENDPLFVHSSALYTSYRREFNGIDAGRRPPGPGAIHLTKGRGKNIILEC